MGTNLFYGLTKLPHSRIPHKGSFLSIWREFETPSAPSAEFQMSTALTTDLTHYADLLGDIKTRREIAFDKHTAKTAYCTISSRDCTHK
jgi:hypothetical protein